MTEMLWCASSCNPRKICSESKATNCTLLKFSGCIWHTIPKCDGCNLHLVMSSALVKMESFAVRQYKRSMQAPIRTSIMIARPVNSIRGMSMKIYRLSSTSLCAIEG